MLIDTIATLQGVENARKAGDIDDAFARQVWRAVQSVSEPGKVGRSVCRYTAFLVAVGGLSCHWTDLSGLWKHLGVSLSSGIIVGSDE